MAPRIAIIGAGPGGCMLARLLIKSDPSTPVTIFEGEASVNYRSQGGTLDLRTSTGLAAVKKAGLWDEFQKYARYDGESLLVTDKNLTTWVKRGGRKAGGEGKKQLQEAPEIDRAVLRKLLMESLPPSTVRWGYKLSRVEESPSGLSLHFANGEVLDGFDLIVGCDGAFSKTRTLLTSEKPYYTGLAGWKLTIPEAATNAPEVYKLANRGSVFVYSEYRSIAIQQQGDGSIDVSSYGHYPEDYTKTCGFDANNLEEAKKELKKQLHDWRPELVNAIDKASEGLAWRNLYQLPVGFTWQHTAGVTLLGDAAHVMTPFAGIGVNTAFNDAMVLAKQINEYRAANPELPQGESQVDSMSPYIARYETEMFEHAHKAQRLTESSKNNMFFTPGAPRTSIESWVLGHAKQDLPGWCHPLITILVYAGYWVYKLFV